MLAEFAALCKTSGVHAQLHVTTTEPWASVRLDEACVRIHPEMLELAPAEQAGCLAHEIAHLSLGHQRGRGHGDLAAAGAAVISSAALLPVAGLPLACALEAGVFASWVLLERRGARTQESQADWEGARLLEASGLSENGRRDMAQALRASAARRIVLPHQRLAHNPGWAATWRARVEGMGRQAWAEHPDLAERIQRLEAGARRR